MDLNSPSSCSEAALPRPGWRGAADREASVSSLWINGEAARGRGHVTLRKKKVTLADPPALARQSAPGRPAGGGTGLTRGGQPRVLNLSSQLTGDCLGCQLSGSSCWLRESCCRVPDDVMCDLLHPSALC
ncbi:hypothetical protein ABVT39_019833 [Epinephelus coioides]